jgi:hypothetical protein
MSVPPPFFSAAFHTRFFPALLLSRLGLGERDGRTYSRPRGDRRAVRPGAACRDPDLTALPLLSPPTWFMIVHNVGKITLEDSPITA